jgi:hypothetical protein
MSREVIEGLTAVVWCLWGVLWIAVVLGIIVIEVRDWWRYR